MTPYFASRVSEASTNLSDLAAVTIVQPVMHVPGDQNPADIPTRDHSKREDVVQESIWQSGPSYLSQSRDQWPFSRNFLDYVPEQELRSTKAAFNVTNVESWQCILGPRLSSLVNQVMVKSNCLSKVTNVVARLLKCLFCKDVDKIRESLTVDDIQVASQVLFIVSMGPSFVALENGKLESLRPVVQRGIVYARSRCDAALLSLLGID